MAQAVEAAINTSGRAILFAGVTVVIALLGMFALGVSLLSGAAVAASIGVVLVLAASLTLLPALLSLIGRRVGEAGGRRSSPQAGRRASRFLAAVGPARAAAPRADRRGGDGADARPRRVPPSDSASPPATPATTRPTRPHVRRSISSPRDSAPASTARSSWRWRSHRPHDTAALTSLSHAVTSTPGVVSVTPPRAQPRRDRGRRRRLPDDLAAERTDLESGHAAA